MKVNQKDSPDDSLWFVNLLDAAKSPDADKQFEAYNEVCRAIQAFTHVLVQMTESGDALVREDADQLMRTLVERGVGTLWELEIDD